VATARIFLRGRGFLILARRWLYVGMRTSFTGRGMRKAEQGMTEHGNMLCGEEGIGKTEHEMTDHGNELCGEEGMGKVEHGMRRVEQEMVAEPGMTDYSYKLNK
jgi:hypothetical protein